MRTKDKCFESGPSLHPTTDQENHWKELLFKQRRTQSVWRINIEEGLQILNVGLNTLSPFPHPRKQSGLFKIKHAPSSSLGVYPGTVNILFTDLEQRK